MENIKLRKRRAFIFPILVGVMAIAMTITSVMMTSIISKISSISRGSVCSLRANYAASAAIESLAHDPQFDTVTSSASCVSGSYVVPNTGACALPGAVGTIITMDTSCSYSEQVVSRAAGLININAIGRCTDDECKGSSGSIIKINTDVKGIIPACVPACDNVHCGGTDGCGGTCGCVLPQSCGSVAPGICN